MDEHTLEPTRPSCRAGDRSGGAARIQPRIHLGGQAAVVVPLAEFLRLRALESTASAQTLEDAEDAAAAQDWLARDAGAQTNYLRLPELRRRLGLAD